ncbi:MULTISPECIES: hypothetical protein [unclassified Streptomyces]|uniref:hypothetical protein n=1 Tax=unclassified Streptomyces TaxID=2593676 RepID=UPI00130109C8|nr:MULTISPECIES: hypothetical protein [unclassified Streptomyces]
MSTVVAWERGGHVDAARKYRQDGIRRVAAERRLSAEIPRTRATGNIAGHV